MSAPEGGITMESLEAEFPDWEVWQGIDRLWHARLRGATPPVMVHDDCLDGLREEIIRKIAQMEARWHRPEGSTL
jgi:hypothetical protein